MDGLISTLTVPVDSSWNLKNAASAVFRDDRGTVTDAAKAAGVSRQTASEWKNRNASFIAMLNAGRLDVWSHVEDRLRKLTGSALDLLETEIRNGNVSIARDILRAVPKLDLQKIGPTSAQLVRNDIDDKEQALFFEQLARTLADPQP